MPIPEEEQNIYKSNRLCKFNDKENRWRTNDRRILFNAMEIILQAPKNNSVSGDEIRRAHPRINPPGGRKPPAIFPDPTRRRAGETEKGAPGIFILTR
jgi:hypothetical protein